MQSKPIKLLLIEDDSEFSSSIVSRLKKRNIDVIHVESAEAALEILNENNFDVVVSDIKLGGMSGIDFLARVKKINEHLPVILLTGFANLKTAREAVELHAFNYLLKPLQDINDLLIPIKNAVQSYSLYKDAIYLRAYYQSIVENIPAGIVSFDKEERIKFINRTFGKLFSMLDENSFEKESTIFDDFLINKIYELKSKNEDSFEYIIDNDTIRNIFYKNLDIRNKEDNYMVVSEIDITCLSMQEKDILFRFLKKQSESEIRRDLRIDRTAIYNYIDQIQSKLNGKIDLSFWKKLDQSN